MNADIPIQIVLPPNALTAGADQITKDLYQLSEVLIRGLGLESGMGLGGSFGYGADFSNDTFLMHPHCWCERNSPECPWCMHGDNPDLDRVLLERFGTTDYGKYASRHYYDPPHFWHRASDFRVRWYKWIGRDMETNRDVTSDEWAEIFRACMESVPESARQKAAAQIEAESTPEAKQEQQKRSDWMVSLISDYLDNLQPCWQCSANGNAVPGTFSFGRYGSVAKTTKDASGSCANCGTVTSPEQLAELADIERRNLSGLFEEQPSDVQ